MAKQSNREQDKEGPTTARERNTKIKRKRVYVKERCGLPLGTFSRSALIAQAQNPTHQYGQAWAYIALHVHRQAAAHAMEAQRPPCFLPSLRQWDAVPSPYFAGLCDFTSWGCHAIGCLPVCAFMLLLVCSYAPATGAESNRERISFLVWLLLRPVNRSSTLPHAVDTFDDESGFFAKGASPCTPPLVGPSRLLPAPPNWASNQPKSLLALIGGTDDNGAPMFPHAIGLGLVPPLTITELTQVG